VAFEWPLPPFFKVMRLRSAAALLMASARRRLAMPGFLGGCLPKTPHRKPVSIKGTLLFFGLFREQNCPSRNPYPMERLDPMDDRPIERFQNLGRRTDLARKRIGVRCDCRPFVLGCFREPATSTGSRLPDNSTTATARMHLSDLDSACYCRDQRNIIPG